ncbi:DUF3300 domain-containing protein [Rheinheimera sp. MMS21-TC3]|uniref:DUF3300 domain-containing protein n=1 Tax=Rheinheimera sp. MMS21-TC3 TaxID=3072790 RepID=UPI0028C3A2EC|nr:DUF3300 domain-containing protein [Rheinheimera sp. MMS21-TC3]WNO59975.1 DUF3300 domain-containing protein [Rheinheimera sp. MMS21-TC3]
MKRLLMQLSYAMTVCLMLLLSPVTAIAADNTISEAELDQMLAPIALYPDTVLTHIIIAATYPLEVVQADRWAKRNSKLSSQAAVNAVEDENWDPSVKALIAFPQILARLSDDLSWTEQLGEAFLQDETTVLARVQLLRQKADKQGFLNDTKHLVVERERDVIIIEPARKEVIYVPVYDTRVVYGNWWWPAYPPVYWHNAATRYNRSSLNWGVSVNVNPWFYFGVFDWHQRHIIVNHNYYYAPPRYYPRRRVHFTASNRWYHDSYHRRGVHYRNNRLNERYNGGYGPKQSTREYKGQANTNNRHVNSQTRETRPTYQRRSAEQVAIPHRNINQAVPNRSHSRQDTVINNRRDRDNTTTTREIRTAPRDNTLPVDRVKPIEQIHTRRFQQTEDTRINVRKQPINTSQLREQQASSQPQIRQSIPQQRANPPTRPAPQIRNAPERQVTPSVVRESRSQAQRQTITTRRQEHRNID